jgi:eukaryotic-like serine/threonine-protein kinase
VLDFGLAKQAQANNASASVLTAMTAGKPLTVEGTIVGTYQYMAPEQIEGSEADTRSDIFALGCVLYEMATGKRAFAGKTQASVIASILATDPPLLSRVAPMTPPALERLVRSCMAKEREERIQSAHDVKLQLEWIAEAGSQAGIPAPVVARRRISQKLAWIVAGVAALARDRVCDWICFARTCTRQATASQHSAAGAARFRSAERCAFARRHQAGVCGERLRNLAQLWVRPLDSTAAQPLAGTDDAVFPFWSPDSRSLGFFAQGKLRVIDASGGAVQTLADAPQSRGGAWGADGTILYTPDATSRDASHSRSRRKLQPERSARRRRRQASAPHAGPCFCPMESTSSFFNSRPTRGRGEYSSGGARFAAGHDSWWDRIIARNMPMDIWFSSTAAI